jgi:hypothetical protein
MPTLKKSKPFLYVLLFIVSLLILYSIIKSLFTTRVTFTVHSKDIDEMTPSVTQITAPNTTSASINTPNPQFDIRTYEGEWEAEFNRTIYKDEDNESRMIGNVNVLTRFYTYDRERDDVIVLNYAIGVGRSSHSPPSKIVIEINNPVDPNSTLTVFYPSNGYNKQILSFEMEFKNNVYQDTIIETTTTKGFFSTDTRITEYTLKLFPVQGSAVLPGQYPTKK